MERREVTYRGRVQGVGFRYTARRIAADYAVSGFVENLPDGSVQLVAEGEPREVERFLGEIARTMQGYIGQVSTARLPATGEFSSFGIRH